MANRNLSLLLREYKRRFGVTFTLRQQNPNTLPKKLEKALADGKPIRDSKAARDAAKKGVLL
ncbi:MAG: hypothetical protein AAFY15_01145 [Cyanobacteria bacterium J06648_11]